MFSSQLFVILLFAQIFLSETQLFSQNTFLSSFPTNTFGNDFGINQNEFSFRKVEFSSDNDNFPTNIRNIHSTGIGNINWPKSDFDFDSISRSFSTITTPSSISSTSCKEFFEYKKDTAGNYVGIITITEPGTSFEKVTNAVFSATSSIPSVSRRDFYW